ncbi:MAG: siphovirus ReqiPepy6 Gp37-like family protein [Eubacteriales bacterium]
MELIFLDENFNKVSSPIEKFKSLIWSRRYYKHGSFSLILPVSLFRTVKNASYLYNVENGGCAEITGISLSKKLKTVTLTGNLLEALFDRRYALVDTKLVGTNVLETLLRSFITTNAITGARAIPYLSLGTAAGYTISANTAVKQGTKVSDALYDVLKPLYMSYSINLNYSTGLLSANIIRGKDRRQSQSVNSWATFSSSFENLLNYSYERSYIGYANYAYVLANDATHGRVLREVDQTSGAVRREMFIISNVSSLVGGTQLSLDAYQSLLSTIGTEALAESRMTETVSGDIDTQGNLKYREHYDLGDWCDIAVPELGLSWEAQITTVDEVYEKDAKRVIPGFGDESLNMKQYIKKEIKRYGT